MQENLKRSIGTRGLSFAIVNLTVGTGIFVLPALASENLGAAAILSYFICGLAIFFIALCFAEVGSKINISGGTYAYIETAFGPFAGFLANTIYLASSFFSDAATASAIATTLHFFLPVIDTPAIRPLLFLVLFGGLACINIRGVKSGMRFVIISTLSKLIPLFLLIALGFGHISMQHLAWNGTPTLHDTGSSTLVLFYAFMGIEVAVVNGGEFKNPSRTVPLGILYGLSFVLLLYVSVQIVTQGVLGNHLQDFKEAPLVAVASLVLGNAGKILIVIATAISMLGYLSGEMLANPRVIYAGARDGIFPGVLFKVHPKFETPSYAIVLYAVIGYLLAVFGAFRQLIVLSSASVLLIYLGVAFAVIKLRFKKSDVPKKGFTNPGGIAVPVIATAIIVWILSNLSEPEIKGILIALVVLSAIFFSIKLFKKRNYKSLKTQ
ncbi:MAG TPA: amino acid permease [Chitinophagaceae bacterium]|nr:amino acid permease [Chitinophagaceae bacterium]